MTARDDAIAAAAKVRANANQPAWFWDRLTDRQRDYYRRTVAPLVDAVLAVAGHPPDAVLDDATNWPRVRMNDNPTTASAPDTTRRIVNATTGLSDVDIDDLGGLAPDSEQGETNPIVCICGSTRFRDEIADANRRLTMCGNIVVAPGVFGHSGDPLADDDKARLDALHFRKIAMADRVYVVNPGGYIGHSTRREIAHAKRLGKPVDYSAPSLDEPAEGQASDSETKLKPAEWCMLEGIEILDADGWRGSRSQDFDEPVPRAEFLDRLSTCTQRKTVPTSKPERVTLPDEMLPAPQTTEHHTVKDVNLGYWRTGVTCSCGDKFMFGDHAEDPTYDEAWRWHILTAKAYEASSHVPIAVDSQREQGGDER